MMEFKKYVSEEHGQMIVAIDEKGNEFHVQESGMNDIKAVFKNKEFVYNVYTDIWYGLHNNKPNHSKGLMEFVKMAHHEIHKFKFNK